MILGSVLIFFSFENLAVYGGDVNTLKVDTGRVIIFLLHT